MVSELRDTTGAQGKFRVFTQLNLGKSVDVQRFLNKLMDYEREFYQSYDMIDLGVKNMLKYSPLFNVDASGLVAKQTPAAHAGAPTKPMVIKYQALITAYRIVDAILWFYGQGSQFIVTRTLNPTPSSWEVGVLSIIQIVF